MVVSNLLTESTGRNEPLPAWFFPPPGIETRSWPFPAVLASFPTLKTHHNPQLCVRRKVLPMTTEWTTPKTRTTTYPHEDNINHHTNHLVAVLRSILLGSPDAEPPPWMPPGCPASVCRPVAHSGTKIACPTGPINFNICQQFSTYITVHHARPSYKLPGFWRIIQRPMLQVRWGTEHTAWLQLTWAMSQP